MITAYPQNQNWNHWNSGPWNNYTTTVYPPIVPNQQPVVPAPQEGLPTIHRVVWVQGREAAKSIQLSPNENVMALDSESDHFYLLRAGQDGKPLPFEVFSFTRDETATANPDYVTRQEFDDLKASLDALRQPPAAPKEEGE